MESARLLAYDFQLKHKILPRGSNLTYINKQLNIKSLHSNIAPYYLFSDTVNTSCIIVSGDERMKTILAYTDCGTWKSGDIPPAMLDLLNLYEKQYYHLQNFKDTPKPTAFLQIPDVAPLLTSRWNQDSPYNDLCPNGCPSGCVATAMSQIMRYHRYPQQGVGNFSYRTETKGYKCEFDFSSTTFHWENMRDSYSSTPPINQDMSRQYIASATYACGVAVGMDYEKDGSGAYMADVPYALINFFGYNKNTACLYRPYFKSEEWYSLLCEELINGRPVLYGGVDSKYGGHAFVVDGCSSATGKFHVNWGWGGECDGYFELDALDPDVYKFSTYQDMLINVSPLETGTRQDVFYAQRFSASTSIGIGKTITFTLTDVFNHSSSSLYVDKSAKFYGTMGIGIFNDNFKFIHALDSCQIEGLTQFRQYSKKTFTAKIESRLFPSEGKYYIAPYVRNINSSLPTRIRTMNASTDYIAVTIEGNDIDDGSNDEESIEVTSFWNEDFENLKIPENWCQEIINGNSSWNTRKVLMQTTNSIPMAAKGNGYAYLDYSTPSFTLNNNRSITRLVTEYMSLSPDSVYEMSFQFRKYTDNPDASDLFSVYCETDSGWVSLGEYAVMNQSEWIKNALTLPYMKQTRFAFEANLSRTSSLFLDDIVIYINHDKSSIDNIKLENPCQANGTAIYTLSGMKIPIINGLEHTISTLQRGIYLIKQNNKIKKVMVK